MKNTAVADAFRTALRIDVGSVNAKNGLEVVLEKIKVETKERYGELFKEYPDPVVLDAMVGLYSTETTMAFVEGPLRIVQNEEFQADIKKKGSSC